MPQSNAHCRFAIVALTIVQAFSSTAMAEDDWSALRGKWRLTSCIFEGEPRYVGREIVWEFDPPMVRITEEGRNPIEFKYRLDAHASPKQFDASYTGDNAALKEANAGGVEGIYEIKGDILRRCFPIPGRGLPRPDKFDASAGSDNVMITLKRIK